MPHVRLTLSEARALALEALIGCGASPRNAEPVARSIIEAEAQGIHSVAFAYLPVYCEHLLCGKVVGQAEIQIRRTAPAALLVDAGNGFAHAAFDRAEPDFVEVVKSQGAAVLGITNSYSAGVLGWFVERLARNGLFALGVSNASPSIAAWGGRRPVFGTNPLAFACPSGESRPIVVDQSASLVAKVKLLAKAELGEAIPDGWALDPEGRPTNDPQRAVAGTMAPAGGAKGINLALLTDLLAAALTGARFSYEASSFGSNEGGPPATGQFFLALRLDAFGRGDVARRVADLARFLLSEEGVRLPGQRRHDRAVEAERDGVTLDAALVERLRAYRTGRQRSD